MKNVRTLVSVILSVICLFACVAAAEPVQSPTKPGAVINQVVTEVEAEGVEQFIIEVVETEMWSETAVEVFEEITLALADPEVAPVSIFTEEELEAVAEMLPVEYDVANLAIAEYIPLEIINYTPEIGDAAVHFALPGEYTEEDVIIAMFKPFNGDESTWIVLEVRVTVAEGADAEVISSIEVLFTQEVLEMLNANEGVLLILRG